MLSVKSAAYLRHAGVAVVMLHPGWINTDMGGANAALDLTTTSFTIADTISKLGMADSGRFIRWDGTEHPW